MKAIFKNIGPVNKAELELKDLTIIAGPNNTGKTYLAYTLYGFLRLMQDQVFLRHKAKNLPFDVYEATEDILSSGNIQIPVKDFDKIAKKLVRQVFRISSESISDIFSSPPEDFKGAEFALFSEYSIPNQVEKSLNFRIGMKEGFQLTASFEKDMLSFYLKNYESSLPPYIMEDILVSLFFKLFAPELPDPFILSAERFGISLFYKELDFTKSRLVEALQKLKDKGKPRNIDPVFLLMDQASSRYAQPIKDNIDYTRALEFSQKKRSALINSKLFDHIKDMLDGYFKYKDGGIRFISKARKHGKFDIPLHLASSSARGLSDLYFFLKHVAHKNHLLIIDEPESHLNPANQIEMARLLARCVNAGLKVLVTTHSDYIIREFNNLIMLSQDFEGKENFLKSNKQYFSSDYLRPETIGAYICENGTLTPCKVDNKGMNIQSFDNTIDEINRIADELDFLTDSVPVE